MQKDKTTIKYTLALTGGGTMGHISPNIALLPELKKLFKKIIYIGSKNSMEEKVAKQNGLAFFAVDTIKFDRKNLLKNLKIPFTLAKAKKQVHEILESQKVDIVFSKGGYVSVPVMLEAQKMHIPNILHESDMSLGLANKLSAINSTKIFVATNKTRETLSEKLDNKCETVGIPVSDSFKCPAKTSKAKLLSSSLSMSPIKTKKIMVITGGSQGSKAINELIYNNLDALTEKYNIYHIVGNGKMDKTKKSSGYTQLEFVNDMYNYFLKADVIISRAGATTIFEGLKAEANMLVIPLPKSKFSRGDQVENAKYFSKLGLVDYIEEHDLNLETLTKALRTLETNNALRKSRIKKFNQESPSNETIAKMIFKTIE